MKKTKKKKRTTTKVSCPTCNKEITYHNDFLKDRKGQPSFCFNCGDILVWTEDLTLRAATTEELANVDWVSIQVFRNFLKQKVESSLLNLRITNFRKQSRYMLNDDKGG